MVERTHCRACTTDNPHEAVYCKNCGTRLWAPQLISIAVKILRTELTGSVLRDPGGFYQLFHGRRLEIARSLLGASKTTALDVGCGNGFLKSLGFTDSIGMDVRLSPAVTVRASAENLPFRDRIFDLVFAGEVLEHLNEPAQALNEWTRVLRTGGSLCLSTPNGRLVRLKGNHPEHKHLFTAGDLEIALTRRGIKRIKVRAIYLGLVSGRRLFELLPWKTLKLFLLHLPVPSSISYDLFLAGVKDLDSRAAS